MNHDLVAMKAQLVLENYLHCFVPISVVQQALEAAETERAFQLHKGN